MSGITRRGLGVGLAALSTVGTLSGLPAAAEQRPRSYPLLNQPAPAFAFPGLNGGRQRLQDYEGLVLVLHFWGLWCPDSVADGRSVHALARNAADLPGVAFLGVHAWGRFGRWGSVERYFEETGFSYPVAFDEGRTFARNIYRIAWFPSYLAIDREGTIRAWRTDLGRDGAVAFLAQVRALAA